MANNIPDAFKRAAFREYNGVTDIKRPQNGGTQNNVVFVEASGQKYVMKFNARDMILKNQQACRLLIANGIPVPDSRAGQYNGIWYETYPMIAEKTLFEHIGNGMSRDTIKYAFENIMNLFAKMDKIRINSFVQQGKWRIHDVVYAYNINANGRAAAEFFRPIIYILNLGQSNNTGIYHSDLTPKNVIVDQNGNIVSMLDIDSVAISNRNFALGATLAKYYQLGFDVKDLYDAYEKLSGHAPGKVRANTIMHLNNLGKYIMWKLNQHKSK